MRSKIDFLNRFLRGRGLTLVPEGRWDSMALERHLKALIAAYRITTVIDVGANFGQFRDLIRGRAHWDGPVVSFEPVKRYFTEIQQRANGTDNWRVFNFALGNETGEREITLFDSPGLASLRTADLDAMRALLPRHSVNVTSRELISIRRLSDVFADAMTGLDATSVLLKIDTQGNDLDVVRGSDEILSKVAVIQTELSFLPIYSDAPSFLDTIVELRAKGFEISNMFPVTTDEDHRAVEMDCLFVSSAHAKALGVTGAAAGNQGRKPAA